MPEAVIVDAARSPMAKGRPTKPDRPGGAMSQLHPADLLGQVLRSLVDRNDIDPAEVDDVIVGCVSQVAEQAGPVGRWAWLGAGLPESVPSVTVDRRCGSSLQCFDFAAHSIIAGAADMIVVAGVESMSRVPMFTARMGQDPYGPRVHERYPSGLVPQGISAELVAARWGVSRAEMDAYSARSHQRAAQAPLTDEITPITVPTDDGEREVREDETIRPATTAEALSTLTPAFIDDVMAARYPEITWSITAGNSSQLTDGASALLVMSDTRAHSLGLTPRARYVGSTVAAEDPITMLSAPIPATEKLMSRLAMSLNDIDHVEVNEAFASVPLAWSSHFDFEESRLNPRGGAIALGHPLGASGGRLLISALHGLEEGGGERALITMCEAGGMANATVIERC